MGEFSNELKNYSERISSALKGSPFDSLEKTALKILEARDKGKWIFTAGNGGSASTASHLVNDLVKGLSLDAKKRIKAKALCDSMPIVTALANDYDYGRIYTEQLINYASQGDLLLLISGSGNSLNVVNAAKYANKAGLTVISFTGRDGGMLKGLSDICCIASTDIMEEIEDVHLVWCHALITILRGAIEKERD